MANPNPSPDTRFQPGQSGNPSGRPKGSLADKLRALLDSDAKPGTTWGDAFVKKLLMEAMKGKPAAMALLTQIEKPPKHAEDKPTAVEVRVVYVDPNNRPGTPGPACGSTGDSEASAAL